MGNTVFFWVKRLMERWYLLITGKFLFWTFWWCEIRSFFESRSWWKDDIYLLLKSSCLKLSGDGKYGSFLSQEVDGKMTFTGYWEVLILNFSVMGNAVFFSAKKLMERRYYLVFWSFPWYSTTWEIWLFVQWQRNWISFFSKKHAHKVN